MTYTGTRWTSKTIRIDIDTGEQITEGQAKKYYKLVRTLKPKKEYANKQKTIGIVEYTKLYRNRNQIEIQWGESGGRK